MLKKFLKNASYNTSSQIVMILLSLSVVPFYVSKLTVAGYGVYSFINGFLGYFSVMQLGLGPAVIRFTAKYYAEKKYGRINKMISLAIISQLCIGGMIAIIVCCYNTQVLTLILNHRIDYLEEAKTALSISSINFVLNFTSMIYFSALKGLQRYDISARITIANNIGATILSVIFVWLGYGIAGIISAWFIVNIIVFALLQVILKKVYKELSLDFNISITQLKSIYGFGIFLFIGRLNRLGINALPTLMIGHYIGPAGIAYYEITKKILSQINNFFSNTITVLFPMVSELKAHNHMDRVKHIYLKANKFMGIISTPFYVFLGIYAWSILNVWVGEEVATSAGHLMVLLSFTFYLSSITMVPGNFIIGLGYSKSVAITGTVQIIVLCVALPLLLKKYLLLGTGFCFFLFEIVGIVYAIYITRFVVGVSVSRFLIKDRVLSVVLSIAAFAPIHYLIKEYMDDNDKLIVVTLLGGSFVFGSLIYYGLSLLLGLVDYGVKEKFKGLVKKAA